MFKLDAKEWELLKLIRDCLKVCDGVVNSNNLVFINCIQEPATACQSFSAATRPTLLRALPALEFMQEKWEAMSKLRKYAPVADGLKCGLENLRKWYKNMDDTDIYMISVILDPGIKMEYFKVHWDEDYLEEGLGILNKVVCA